MKKRPTSLGIYCGLSLLTFILIFTSSNCTQSPTPDAWHTSEPTSQPETQSTNQPAFMIAHEPLFNNRGILQFQNVMKQLTLTAEESKLMDSIKDYNDEEITSPLYLILTKTSTIPDIDSKFYPIFDRPSFQSLVFEPKRYRMQPFRIAATVYTSRMLSVQSGELAYNNRWPPEQPVWKLTAKKSDPYDMGYESLIIYTTENPDVLLGSPSNQANGTNCYAENGRKVQILCTLYKILQAPDREGRRIFDFPIVVAWQIVRPESSKTAKNAATQIAQ